MVYEVAEKPRECGVPEICCLKKREGLYQMLLTCQVREETKSDNWLWLHDIYVDCTRKPLWSGGDWSLIEMDWGENVREWFGNKNLGTVISRNVVIK